MYSSSSSYSYYSSNYPVPVPSYSEQLSLKSLGRNLLAYLPYAFAPVGVYGLCKLIGYLIPGPQHQKRLDLKDKTVLIVGASTGLGRQMAFDFYAKGAKLILTARSIDKLEQLCDELVQWGKDTGVGNPYSPAYRYLDVSELNGGDDGHKQIRELCSYAIDGKTIDVLVNNAGLSSRGSIAETPVSVHRRIMEVNFFGFVAITRALLDCIPDDGAILCINSIQGRVALPYRSPYSCSKHAIQAFFDSLRGEERPQLQILTVNAAYINTGFGSRALDAEGRPVGREDPNQLHGMSPEYASKRIIGALQSRQTELLLAPFHIRLVVLLRVVAPNLVWWLFHRRAVAELRGQ